MVFRISNSSKRSARESWRTTRIWAGVIGGSSGSLASGSATEAGTAAAGRSASAGAAGAVGGASGLGLGLFLEPGGLPRRLRAGGARLWRGSWRGGWGMSRCRSWRSRSNIVRGRRGSSRLFCLDRLFHRFPPSIYCPALVRPTCQPSRYMQKLMLVPRKFTTLPS